MRMNEDWLCCKGCVNTQNYRPCTILQAAMSQSNDKFHSLCSELSGSSTKVGALPANLKKKKTNPWKIWGFQSVRYEEYRLLRYTNSVRTSQGTYYVSITECSRLMLCKICFHGADYEEYRLLGYKNSVRTSQEARYVSATKPSQLIRCKSWGFHGDNYEQCRILECYAMWLLQ
jgi:hypothetical protein